MGSKERIAIRQKREAEIDGGDIKNRAKVISRRATKKMPNAMNDCRRNKGRKSYSARVEKIDIARAGQEGKENWY